MKKQKISIATAILVATVVAVPAIAASTTRDISATFRNIKISVDGQNKTTSNEPFIYDNNTYVPLRFVSEALGANVEWDDATSSIKITTKKAEPEKPPTQPETPSQNTYMYGKITKLNDYTITIQRGTGIDPNSYNLVGSGTETSFTITAATQITDISSGVGIIKKLSDLNVNDVIAVTMDGSTYVSLTRYKVGSGGNSSNGDGSSSSGNAALVVSEKDQTISNKTYDSTTKDQNALLVKNGGYARLTNVKLNKSGNAGSSSLSTNGSNAIAAIIENASSMISTSTLKASSTGSDGVFVSGARSSASLNDTEVTTTGSYSRGFVAYNDSSISGDNMKINTSGSDSVPLYAATESSKITLNNSTVSATGSSSPIIYSKGDVSLYSVTGNSSSSGIGVFDGPVSISLTDSKLTGSSGSAFTFSDESKGSSSSLRTAELKVNNGSLNSNTSSAFFSVSNINADISLSSVSMSNSGTLLSVGRDAKASLIASSVNELRGNITGNSGAEIELELRGNTTYYGTINSSKDSKYVSISLDSSSSWRPTGTSYVHSIENSDSSFNNVVSSYDIYYNSSSSANSWLNGEEKPLSGGGRLIPSSF